MIGLHRQSQSSPANSSWERGGGIGTTFRDVVWLRPEQEMTWPKETGSARTLIRSGCSSTGGEIPTHDRNGKPDPGKASFLIFFNAHHEPLAFTVPDGLGDKWETVIGSDPEADYPDGSQPGDRLEINSRSLLILRRD